MEYPTDRQNCGYALRYLKWLIASGATNEIGPDATALLLAVVTLEDEFFYQRAPNFFNDQLMTRCGMLSEHSLIRARQRAINAGLLDYTPGKKRTPGRYFVCGFTTDSLRKTQRKSSESEVKARPSIPIPHTHTNNTCSFERWYSEYPRKVGKGNAAKAYSKAIAEITKTDSVDADTAEELLLRWTAERIPSLLATDAQFRPYPATWLNGGHYRDEVGTNGSGKAEFIPPAKVGNYVHKPKVRA